MNGVGRGAAGVAAAVIAVAAIVYGAYYGSDAWHAEQTSKLDAAADSELAKLLGKLDPCSPDPKKVDAVLNALGSKQLVSSDVDELTQDTQAALQRPAKAIARAQARGVVPGWSKDDAEKLAKTVGLDPKVPGWSDDPKCESKWVVTWDQDAPHPSGGRFHQVATIPFTVTQTATLSGSGQATTTLQLPPPPPYCTWSMVPGTTTISVSSQASESTQQFALRFSAAAYVVDGKGVCEIPGVPRVETPLTTPMQAFTDFPMEVAMKDGAQARDERAQITISVKKAS